MFFVYFYLSYPHDFQYHNLVLITPKHNYLPKMMDENEIKNIVKTVIDDIGATSMADMGKIMPEVMKRGNGLIDGKSAQRFVNEIIG